jgi:hypothetical protein
VLVLLGSVIVGLSCRGKDGNKAAPEQKLGTEQKLGIEQECERSVGGGRQAGARFDRCLFDAALDADQEDQDAERVLHRLLETKLRPEASRLLAYRARRNARFEVSVRYADQSIEIGRASCRERVS